MLTGEGPTRIKRGSVGSDRGHMGTALAAFTARLSYGAHGPLGTDPMLQMSQLRTLSHI